MTETSATIDWLLAGDPAIVWKTRRDLLDADEVTVAEERARVAQTGWGRALLDRQQDGGRWSAERGSKRYPGLYNPKWTSTHYTLLLLRRLGLPAGHPQALAGCRELVEHAEWFPSGGLGYFVSRRVAEHCVSAMVLSILEAFDHDDRAARDRLIGFLLAEQKPDGGWNCDLKGRHSSFNTTIAALEALELAASGRATRPEVCDAMVRGGEFLLAHRLFRSHRTGRVVRADFTRFPLTVGWKYDVLRALDHFARVGAPRDARAEDAIELVLRRRRKDGRWVANAPQPGRLHFTLEATGQPSRWITLRCLRALRWWQRGAE